MIRRFDLRFHLEAQNSIVITKILTFRKFPENRKTFFWKRTEISWRVGKFPESKLQFPERLFPERLFPERPGRSGISWTSGDLLRKSKKWRNVSGSASPIRTCPVSDSFIPLLNMAAKTGLRQTRVSGGHRRILDVRQLPVDDEDRQNVLARSLDSIKSDFSLMMWNLNTPHVF